MSNARFTATTRMRRASQVSEAKSRKSDLESEVQLPQHFFFFESMHHPSLLPEKAANASGWHALFTADPIFTFLALSMRRGTSCRLQ